MVKAGTDLARANTCAHSWDGGQLQADVVGGQDTEDIVALRRSQTSASGRASEEAQLKGKSCILLVPARVGQPTNPAETQIQLRPITPMRRGSTERLQNRASIQTS